ncbi:DUF4180 domain-containing protein [Paenibacillus sp. XY044]|uniref:DUF4180 domain-containing protein n=1 Tax=Paenibacillus sp. XY044 TaxID=2026089 RepID=UPI000B9947B2|nr:DUF4180 domain-containing protein [Paenibacillus sp. XY044]OZB98444.1 cytoplasmic protein [Paenibacillus sp. XY044]
MNYTIHEQDGSKVAVLEDRDAVIHDVQTALDLMADIGWNPSGPCHKLLLNQSNMPEAFFDLKSGFAGEILQKYRTYQFKIAIVGDFEAYSSKSLRDFIYECNQGQDVFFMKDGEEALAALHRVP